MKISSEQFQFVQTSTPWPVQSPAVSVRSFRKNKALYIYVALFALLSTVCFSSGLWISDAGHAELAAANTAPCMAYPFGTDSLGRNIAHMVLVGGRTSLCIGLLSALISTAVAVLYGTLCAILPRSAGLVMQRACELLMSIPSFLLVVFVQAVLDKESIGFLAVVIGMTGWMGMTKVVYAEVNRIRQSDMVLSAKALGAGFWHILCLHLLPNIFPAIAFMSASSVAAAIGTESTLSFLGIGLPLEVVSWGSMLSLSQNSILAGRWWFFVFPSLFLAVALVCITQIAQHLHQHNQTKCSNLM